MKSILDFLQTFLLKWFITKRIQKMIFKAPICIKMKSHPGVIEYNKCLHTSEKKQ